MLEPPTIYEPPREFTIHNVMFWESTSIALRNSKKEGNRKALSILTKAKKFLEENCIERISETEWICKPRKKYNKTPRRIRETDSGTTCTCQGFKKKQRDFEEGHSNIKPTCSHIIAMLQFEFLKAREVEDVQI